MSLRVSRTRSTNSTLLLVASTRVRVEQLQKKVQLLNRLVKENGGEFQTKKQKKKKKDSSKTTLEENVSDLDNRLLNVGSIPANRTEKRSSKEKTRFESDG